MIEQREYQTSAIKALKEHYKKSDKGTLVLPTGAGKTFTAWTFLRDEIKAGKRILWLVHRSYLIDQAYKSLFTMIPRSPANTVSFWTADEKNDKGQIVFAMILSTKELKSKFDWVIVDEAHRAAADSYKRLFEQIKFDKKLCLTATPGRLDKKDIDGGEIVYQVKFADLVKSGYLSRPNLQVIKTGCAPAVKFNYNGELTNESLKLLNVSNRNELIAKTINEGREKWGKTLIFACDINHMNELTKLIPNCLTVHSKMDSSSKDAALQQFKEPGNHTLINCEVFIEGYDQPDINTIVMARPTTSKSLWVQMIGRGARICAGKKSFNLVIFLDDIGKYEYLVNEWCLDNVEEFQQLETINKQKRILGLLKEEGITTKIDEYKISSISAILKLKTPIQDVYEIMLIDKDQLKALLVLEYHFNKCIKEDSDNIKDQIESSYAYCVSDGEFTINEWRNIVWAKYLASKKRNGAIYHCTIVEQIDTTPEHIKELHESNTRLLKEFNEKIKSKLTKRSQTSFTKGIAKAAAPKLLLTRSIKSVIIEDGIVKVQSTLKQSSFGFHTWTSKVLPLLREELDEPNLQILVRLQK